MLINEALSDGPAMIPLMAMGAQLLTILAVSLVVGSAIHLLDKKAAAKKAAKKAEKIHPRDKRE